MKTTFLRTLLALGALAALTPLAAAQQRGFDNVLEQWSAAQSANTSDSGVEEASYASDGEAMDEETTAFDEQVTDDLTRGLNGSCNTCSHEGCPCDACQGGCEGDCYVGCPTGCESNYCGDCNSDCAAACGMYYAEVQNMFMRAHVSEDVVGKLKEKYEYSPRVVLGYEGPSGLGARARYWNYTRTTNTVNNNDSLRFDLDVIDLEGTSRFSTKRADLLLSGGFRWADMNIVEDDDDEVDAEMPGITFAADARAGICGGCNSQWSGVCGARWSMLGGDWEGDNNNVIDPTRDDNITTQEIYGGFEYLCHRCGYDLYARFVFEMQNWHSDALGETSATDSIGFVGPAIHGGISF
jgi:hypothetical protein